MKKYLHMKTCIKIFLVALFIIIKNGNIPNIHHVINGPIISISMAMAG